LSFGALKADTLVTAGLDPAIYASFAWILRKDMDARVKPEHDDHPP